MVHALSVFQTSGVYYSQNYCTIFAEAMPSRTSPVMGLASSVSAVFEELWVMQR